MIESIIRRIKTEPALVIAFLASVIQALEAEAVVTWRTVLTVAIGVAIRPFVTPEVVAKQREENAAIDGYVLGLGLQPNGDGLDDFQ